MKTTTMMLVLALGAPAMPAVADAVDDDLAVVKKATASDDGGSMTAEARPDRRPRGPSGSGCASSTRERRTRR